MRAMFRWAKAFNGGISKWDVSKVTSMDLMFLDAASFNQQLCGADWVNAKASKQDMFKGSSGSMLRLCTTTTPAFSSKVELEGAVNTCLKFAPKGDSSNDTHGPIAEWDVSRVTDMSGVFAGANSFNGDISKWDVSSMTDTSFMFTGATSFNGGISKSDVSSVATMADMFSETHFTGDNLEVGRVKRY